MHDVPVPGAVRSKLTHRVLLLITLCNVLIAAYVAAWAPLAYDAASTSNLVQKALGEQVDNLFQLFIVFSLMAFLALMAPEDLESKDMRKYVIGPMLAVSWVGATFVAFAHARALTANRSAVAAANHNQRVCLNIQYALCAFYYCWGAIYPIIVFFFLRNSWARMRLGLTTDAVVFLTGYALLWAHGEEHYPPGDASLTVALFGRPAVALLGAATFGPQTRRRIAGWGAAAGLFHVQLGLNELTREEIRWMLRCFCAAAGRMGRTHGSNSSSAHPATSLLMSPLYRLRARLRSVVCSQARGFGPASGLWQLCAPLGGSIRAGGRAEPVGGGVGDGIAPHHQAERRQPFPR